MALTTKKTTLQVTFSEQEFLEKLFDSIPEGTVVTAVDVKVKDTGDRRIRDGRPVTTVTVRLTQPIVDEHKEFDTVWLCDPPPKGDVYKVLEDDWAYEESEHPIRYIKRIAFTARRGRLDPQFPVI